jgi:hypothetical protein
MKQRAAGEAGSPLTLAAIAVPDEARAGKGEPQDVERQDGAEVKRL